MFQKETLTELANCIRINKISVQDVLNINCEHALIYFPYCYHIWISVFVLNFFYIIVFAQKYTTCSRNVFHSILKSFCLLETNVWPYSFIYFTYFDVIHRFFILLSKYHKFVMCNVNQSFSHCLSMCHIYIAISVTIYLLENCFLYLFSMLSLLVVIVNPYHNSMCQPLSITRLYHLFQFKFRLLSFFHSWRVVSN